MLSRILKHRKRILGNQFQSKINVDTNGICTLDEFKSKYSNWFERAGEPVYVKIS